MDEQPDEQADRSDMIELVKAQLAMLRLGLLKQLPMPHYMTISVGLTHIPAVQWQFGSQGEVRRWAEFFEAKTGEVASGLVGFDSPGGLFQFYGPDRLG